MTMRDCCSAVAGKLSCGCARRPTEDSQQQAYHESEHWLGRFDFLLASVGYTVGFGNVWTFPRLCFQHSGIVFLLPYLLSAAFAGLPLVFLEMAFGQTTGMGPVHGWKECPIMTGVGWAMCFISGCSAVFYNLFMAWCLRYLIACFNSTLPWASCANEWNDRLCDDFGANNATRMMGDLRPCSENVTDNCTDFERPSVQFYERVVAGYVSYDGQLHKMTDPLGSLQWQLALCLLACWVITFLCLINGFRSFGRVAYVVVPLQYVLLLITISRLVLLPELPGAIKYFFMQDLSKLSHSTVWTAAFRHNVFSVGACIGGHITLASKNLRSRNCYRDALIVCGLDAATSLLWVTGAFTGLLHVSQYSGQSIPMLMRHFEGVGLPIMVYSELFAHLPGAYFWSPLFFVTLLLLGVDTQFVLVETVTTAVLDQWPRLRASHATQLASKGVLCLALCLLGLPLCCQGGIYCLHVIITYQGSYDLHVVAIGEILGVCVFYGLGNFLDDIESMLGFRPGWYWTVCWTVVCPVLFLFVLVFSVVSYRRPTVVHGQDMSNWGELFGYILVISSILIIGVFAVTWRPVLAARQDSERDSRTVSRQLSDVLQSMSDADEARTAAVDQRENDRRGSSLERRRKHSLQSSISLASSFSSMFDED